VSDVCNHAEHCCCGDGTRNRIRTLEALLRHARGLLKDALDTEPNGALDARLRAFLAELSAREGT
jgi:hypothetical protein